MCGICGFIGNENAYQKILDSLYQLQNRGYDSAGICVFEHNKMNIHKYASTNNSSALDRLKEYTYNGNVGIGHTRWAPMEPKPILIPILMFHITENFRWFITVLLKIFKK